MSISHLTAIENMLSQMRAVAQAAGAIPAQANGLSKPSTDGFAAELARSLNKVSQVQNDSIAQTEAFQMGTPGVSLNDVMIDMQKASLAFQTTVQVRNRMVAAYQEIASMAV